MSGFGALGELELGEVPTPSSGGGGPLTRIATSTASATTLTMPAGRAIGDYEIMFAYDSAGVTVPTIPSGWTSINTGGGHGNAGAVAFRVCSSLSDTSGTWTNATNLICAVYRNVTGIGNSAEANGALSAVVINYPADVLLATNGQSWFVGMAGQRSASNVNAAPTGMTNVTSVGTGPMAALHDTNGVDASNWPGVSVSSNTTDSYTAFVVELLGPQNNHGVLAQTLGAFTLASTGQVKVKGVTSSTLGAFTLASTGQVKIKGVAANTLGAFTLSSAAQLKVKGVTSQTLGAFTLSSTGQVKIKGVTSQTLGAFTLASTAHLKVKGVVGATLGPITLAAAGRQPGRTGALSQTLGAITLVASSQLKVKGTTSATISAFTLNSTGKVKIQGVTAKTLGSFTLASTARLKIKGATGGLLNPFTLASTGASRKKGVLNTSIGSFTVVFTGRKRLTPRGQLIMSGM